MRGSSRLVFLLLSALFLFGCVQPSSYSGSAVTPSPLPPFVTNSQLSPHESLPVEQRTAFPSWAYEARLAGFSFYPDFDEGDIEEKIGAALDQNVSVMLIDTPLGWDYAAWENDTLFEKNRRLVGNVARLAHRNRLKVALYLTGLEVTGPAGINPLKDHPDWLQEDKDGYPAQFEDITSRQEHWLEQGEVDAWLSPESSYRSFFLNRTLRLAPLVDALWIDTAYLQVSIGGHDELWPSYDNASLAAFERKTGLKPPRTPDWNNPDWKAWVAWRKESIRRFLEDVKNEAQAANPGVLVFAENWNVDSPLATGYAQDPVLVGTALPTAPEISTVADRTDLGQLGMGEASLKDWQAFAAMVAFSVSANRGAPTWVLTYGANESDALKTAGVVLAFGGQFYEAKGPSMLDDSVGASFRKKLFSWIARESRLLSEPRQASVAVWYSPEARDFLDQNGAGLYEETTPFFSSYRSAARKLLEIHVPFKMVFDVSDASKYDLLLLPTACIAKEKILFERALVVGDLYDAFCENRIRLSGRKSWPAGTDLPKDTLRAVSRNADFLANVGEKKAVRLPVRKEALKARFSTPEKVEKLEIQEGFVTTPAFTGPAIVEWVRPTPT